MSFSSERLSDLTDFDGQHLDSTNAVTNETFSRVYATLYGSITDVAYQLPHPQQAYLAAMDAQDSSGDILHLQLTTYSRPPTTISSLR